MIFLSYSLSKFFQVVDWSYKIELFMYGLAKLSQTFISQDPLGKYDHRKIDTLHWWYVMLFNPAENMCCATRCHPVGL